MLADASEPDEQAKEDDPDDVERRHACIEPETIAGRVTSWVLSHPSLTDTRVIVAISVERKHVYDLTGQFVEIHPASTADTIKKTCELAAVAKTRIAELEAENAKLQSFMRELFEDGCEYGDDCPIGVPLNHYECRSCRVRRFLAENID